MEAFTKIVKVGLAVLGPHARPRTVPIYCKIEYTLGPMQKPEVPRLSISGVEGPSKNGQCHGSWGQLVMHYRTKDEIDSIARCWSYKDTKKFFELWDRWHLNHMRAGTSKQEKYLWEHAGERDGYTEQLKLLIDVGLNPDSDNGYVYGSQWLYEEVPEDVLQFFKNLPSSPETPAWV